MVGYLYYENIAEVNCSYTSWHLILVQQFVLVTVHQLFVEILMSVRTALLGSSLVVEMHVVSFECIVVQTCCLIFVLKLQVFITF